MTKLLARLGITAHLGRCMFCMHAAFLSAVSLWVMSFAAVAITSRMAIIAPLTAAATTFSALWLAHLATYGKLVVRHQADAAIVGADGFSTSRNRRELFRIFIKAVAAVAVASMLPAVWGSARAEDGCSPPTPAPCGARYCCGRPSLYYCSGYSGNVPNWRQMGTFCTNANSNEDVADLRSNCAVFVSC